MRGRDITLPLWELSAALLGVGSLMGEDLASNKVSPLCD